MILREDYNDFVSLDDKQGGCMRPDSSFASFRSFVMDMEMGDILFQGTRWTWANKMSGEGFTEERLDWFFGSKDWLL